jgi:DNA-binding transcriptional regulator YdaS (Cro superfamily)
VTITQATVSDGGAKQSRALTPEQAERQVGLMARALAIVGEEIGSQDSGSAQAELASRVGVSRAFLSMLKNGKKQVPPGRCAALESATGGAITRYQWRPDFFGEDPLGTRSTDDPRTGQAARNVDLGEAAQQ